VNKPRLRIFAAVFVAAVAFLPACGVAPEAEPAPPERMLLIVIDTLRRDYLSCYGSANATPNIDALADRGQLFSDYTASFHQTSMSMAALFTGRTPSLEFNRAERPLFWNSSTWCGLNRFAEKADDLCLPPSLPTLAELLREAGYQTLGVASNQFLYEPSGFSRGFDNWVEVGKKPLGTGALARLQLPDASKTRYFGRVNSAASEALDRRESDQFFLYVHYMDVHDHGNTATGRYAKSVRSVDWAVGDLLEALAERELLEGTTVILTSDHGERLGERHAVLGKPGHSGNPSFQEVLAVPLIIAPASQRDPAVFLRTQDLFALILELAGADANAETDAELAADELFLSEIDYRTYLRGRWKSAVRRSDDQGLLFDLDQDSGEQRDVAKEYPNVAARQRARIDELGGRLSARRAVLERLSEDDRERLRALGYLDQLENPR